MKREASAPLNPKRQRSQYTCMATSLSMCLEALGIQDAGEDAVNRVMGAAPMQGASWEQAFAAAQHYGARTTLICPATLAQVKEYTDRGIAVMIAWNPEGRPWSHASVIFDVTEDSVSVADPNIPDPDQTVRIVPKAEFYGKWYEKFPDYLVRRPAMAVEREISPEGRQMVASKVAKEVKVDPTKNPYERERGTRNWGAGGHNTRVRDEDKGISRKMKHKRPFDVEATYQGNPDGKAIYPNDIDHGYGEPLAGGTDVMRRLQNNLAHEQGNDDQKRPNSPKVAGDWEDAEEGAPVRPSAECFAYLNQNAVKFPKKHGWWLPAHNMGINSSLSGLNLWVFTILPMFAAKKGFLPANDNHGAGIVIHPSWTSPVNLRETFEEDLENAKFLVDLASQHPTVGETVKAELKWLETHFRIDIPSNIAAKLIQEAPKIAARRWGTERMRLKDVFVPFDGGKPIEMTGFGDPRMASSSLVSSAISVASRYLNKRKEGV